MRSDIVISALLHAALLIWCALSFSIAPLTAAAPDSLPVDIVSDKQFSEMMAGSKSAPKAETPKPLVDKVAEPKPDAKPEPVPTVVEKPEVKPIPKEEQPKQEQAEKPQPPKPDPVVEAMKKEEARKAAEALKKEKDDARKAAEAQKKEEARKAAEAKAKAAAAKKQPAFNPDQIAALLDKRDPQRQLVTGDTINKEPTLGTATGSAATLSQSEIDALRARLAQLWNPPAAAANPQELIVKIRIKIGRDGKLAGPPMVLTSGRGNVFEAARDGAVRALFQAQPFEMLKPEHYDLWKEMEITFDPRDMIPG